LSLSLLREQRAQTVFERSARLGSAAYCSLRTDSTSTFEPELGIAELTAGEVILEIDGVLWRKLTIEEALGPS
jgi:hypothetical protein